MANKAQADVETKVTETPTPETTKAPAKKQAKIDKLTTDNKKHKHGDVVKVKAFGVVVETNY